MSAGFGVYVHWPYCARICPYCDFNVVRDRDRTEEKAALARAIVTDLKGHAAVTGHRRLTSVFFGGGTPSLMDPGSIAQIIDVARGLWSPEPNLEITLEANPSDAETDRFAAFAAAGINRLSLGLQSIDDRELEFLGRNHNAAAGRRAVAKARASFPRLSVDLIYALPGQSADDWARSLREVAAMGSEHISPYQLTIESGTPFARAVRRRTLTPPTDDLAAELLETTQSVLNALGFEAYEVSNHARGEAARSRHNLIYWRGGDYVGVGPGAHGRLTVGGHRLATEAPRSVRDYIDQVDRVGLAASMTRLDAREAALERLFMGLRTSEGVATRDLAPLNLAPGRLEAFRGLAYVKGSRLFATARGRPILDRVIAELVHGG